MTRSNGVMTLITAVVVAAILSGTAVFINLHNSQAQKDMSHARQEARKQCANNIPDEKSSWSGSFGGGYVNYTNYPKFDRCMAGKGF
ncbi:MAG: hypothetical protein EOM45_04315 [Clostridia bacterium]|nr:hypothetical protein [Clostridia bacterium]